METYSDEHLLVDLRRQVAILDNQTLTLTPKEYCLLLLLVEHAGAVVPRATFLKRMWSDTSEMRTRRLDIHVSGLRRKLGQYADRYIETIVGIGYSFRPIPWPPQSGPPDPKTLSE